MLTLHQRLGLFVTVAILLAGCISDGAVRLEPVPQPFLSPGVVASGTSASANFTWSNVTKTILVPIHPAGLQEVDLVREHAFDLAEFHDPVAPMALNLIQPPRLEQITSELWPEDPEAVGAWTVQTSWVTDPWQTFTLHAAGTSHRSTLTNEALADQYPDVDGQTGHMSLPRPFSETRVSVTDDCLWAVFASATPQHVNLQVAAPAVAGTPILLEDAVERFSFEGGGFDHETTLVVNPEPPGTLGLTTGASVVWHMDEGDIVRFLANHDSPGTLHLLDPNGNEIPSEARWDSWSGTNLVARGNAVPSAQVIAGVAGDWSFVVDAQAGQDLSVEIMVIHTGAYTRACPDGSAS